MTQLADKVRHVELLKAEKVRTRKFHKKGLIYIYVDERD